MFRDAKLFNQPVPFDTTSARRMDLMFDGAQSFNQPLNTFSTSNVGDLSYMFRNAISFNADLSSFDTSRVKNFQSKLSNYIRLILSACQFARRRTHCLLICFS